MTGEIGTRKEGVYMIKEQTKRLQLEKEWATYKYNVMERNYSYYKAISKGLHDQKDYDQVKEALVSYLDEPVSKAAIINTLRHVWGYFKKDISPEEKEIGLGLIDAYIDDKIDRTQVKQFLANLALKYKKEYLLSSHYFDDMLQVRHDEFGRALGIWYAENKRDLPWRKTKDPYQVWISEIMCQQTQVGTVINYYNRFLEKWPDIYALSRATEDEVFKVWEGLGYYGRARRMMQLAHIVVEDYQGKFPDNYGEIIKLPGIGTYTAGAILSICFGVKIAAVDGNVMRVISRVFNSHKDIALPQTKKDIEKLVGPLLPVHISDFNQGLMELGALVCTPTNPQCRACPFEDICLARKLSLENQLPIKSKAKKKKAEILNAMLVICQDYILLIKASSQGLLGGLWGLPYVINDIKDSTDILLADDSEFPANTVLEEKLRRYLRDEFRLNIYDFITTDSRYKHVFTHKTWDMRLHVMYSEAMPLIEYPESNWVKFNDLESYPISTAFRRLIKTSEFGKYLT